VCRVFQTPNFLNFIFRIGIRVFGGGLPGTQVKA